MRRNFHLQFINNPKFYGTATEVAAEKIEDLMTRKSWAVCDDSVNWDSMVEAAQANLAQCLTA